MAAPKRKPVASTATAPVAAIVAIAATPVTTSIPEALAAPAPTPAPVPVAAPTEQQLPAAAVEPLATTASAPAANASADLIEVRVLAAFGDHAVNDVVAMAADLVTSLGDLMVDPHPDAVAAARELAA